MPLPSFGHRSTCLENPGVWGRAPGYPQILRKNQKLFIATSSTRVGFVDIKGNTLKHITLECKSPLKYALIHTWLKPASTAGKVADVGLLKAWLFHLAIIASSIFATILWVLVWTDNRHGDLGFLDLISLTVVKMFNDAIYEIAAAPLEVTLGVIAATAVIEFAYICLTIVILPFAANRERIRDSFRHTLRYVWLHSSVVFPASLLCCTTILTADKVHSQWSKDVLAEYAATHPIPEEPKTNDNAAMKAYQQELRDYWMARWDYSRYQVSPWYRAFAPQLAATFTILLIVFVLWSLIRGATTTRTTGPRIRPPTCRACGYNLTGQKSDSRCPECGLSVFESLKPLGSPGAPWEHRRTLGYWRAYYRTVLSCWRTPVEFSRKLTLVTAQNDALSFQVINLGICFLIYVATMISVALVTGNSPRIVREIIQLAPLSGLSFVAALFCMTSIFALIAAASVRIKDGTNIIPGTAQAAAYSSFYLIIWGLFFSLLTIILALDESHTKLIKAVLGTNADYFIELVLPILTLAAIIHYLVKIIKASNGVRYAS